MLDPHIHINPAGPLTLHFRLRLTASHISEQKVAKADRWRYSVSVLLDHIYGSRWLADLPNLISAHDHSYGR